MRSNTQNTGFPKKHFDKIFNVVFVIKPRSPYFSEITIMIPNLLTMFQSCNCEQIEKDEEAIKGHFVQSLKNNCPICDKID